MPFTAPLIPAAAVVTAVLLVSAQSPFVGASTGRSLEGSSWQTVASTRGAAAQLCRETSSTGAAVVWYRHHARTTVRESRTLVRYSTPQGWTRADRTRWIPPGRVGGGRRGHQFSPGLLDDEQVRATVVFRDGDRLSAVTTIGDLPEC